MTTPRRPVGKINHDWDALGRLTLNEFQNNANVAQNIHGYQYDTADRRTQQTRPDASVVNCGYEAYGRSTSAIGPLATANVYRFSSKELHALTGFYYYGYRFYDPQTQRWINRDPISEAGGINLYGFVGNGPIGLVDPYGEFAFADDCFTGPVDELLLLGAFTITVSAIVTYTVVTMPPPDIGYPRFRPTQNCPPATVAFPMQMPGRRESGVKTTDGGTKADDKKDGKRGSSGSDHKRPGDKKTGGDSKAEVKPVAIL